MNDTEARYRLEYLRDAIAEATDESEIERLEREIAIIEYQSENGRDD